MPLMTNAEAFRYDFGIYATELWSMTEKQFLEWLNAECDRERPRDMVVRCKDCRHRGKELCLMYYVDEGGFGYDLTRDSDYCVFGERKDDE